jgi:hypothetical protein
MNPRYGLGLVDQQAALELELTGAHARRCFRAPNLSAIGPKGGGLLGESHHCWW